jgi:uncharacterized SAM-binding protein YcdF (DUF218 family)
LETSYSDAKESRPAARFRSRTCLLTLLVILALLYLFLRGLGAFLITGDRLKTADAVVALGGGGEWRVVEAVRLVQERYGQWLILTEPGEINPGDGPGSRYFRETAIENGLSPFAILVTEEIQRSTHDEAVAVLELMERHQLQSVIVVTDPFHTQRARMIFRQVFDGSGRTVRVHPVPRHWYKSGTWFLTAGGWGNTLREYIKMTGFFLGIYRTLD